MKKGAFPIPNNTLQTFICFIKTGAFRIPNNTLQTLICFIKRGPNNTLKTFI